MKQIKTVQKKPITVIKGTGFEFVETGHKYYLDGHPMTGVTTILGVIAKPALIQWAANMAVAYVIEKWGENGLTHNDLMQVLDEAKKAHTKKKEAAGTSGTDVHKTIENYIKDSIFNHVDLVGKKDENPQVQHFLDWAVANNVKFLFSEQKVYSKELFVAGTIDFICEIQGEVWIGDIKTSSAVYPEHFFQTAGYQRLMKDMSEVDPEMGLEVKGHIILNCRKDGSFEEKRSVSNDDNLAAFMAALTLYRITEKLKGNII